MPDMPGIELEAGAALDVVNVQSGAPPAAHPANDRMTARTIRKRIRATALIVDLSPSQWVCP
jgi:hypothetical protein